MHPPTNHRMVQTAENRTGGDLSGGCADSRNTSRESRGEGVKAIATGREGQLFADADVKNRQTYQFDHE